MKFFLFLIGMVSAGILGYSYEPEMRYRLTGKVPADSVNPASHPAEQLVALPKPAPAIEIPEPMVEEVEKPAEPEMVVEPEPAVPDAPVDIVAVMKASIQSAEIKEFTFDQVLDWSASVEPEDFDGETYQTGMVSYKAETIFGVKSMQAKAMIKGGKVMRWLWPKSGMEIK